MDEKGRHHDNHVVHKVSVCGEGGKQILRVLTIVK